MAKLRAKQINPLLAQPLYLALRTGVCAMGWFDLASTLSAFKRLGRLWARAPFNRSRLRRACDNLRVAFPEWTEQQRLDCAVRSYEHVFMLAAEVVFTPRLLTHEGWAGRVDLQVLHEAVRSVVTRPTIFICGHCGNWEMSGYSLALLGFPVHALYRPLDLKPADEWVRQVRGRRGLMLLDKFGAARRLPEVMGAGSALGFVADQNAGDRGLFVPFFGRMTSTYKAIGLSALRFNATIVVGLALRTGGEEVRNQDDQPTGLHREPLGLRYKISAIDVFGPDDYAHQPDPLFYIAARYRRAIEQSVRIAPEQYLWMHRYWKSRPRWERQGRTIPESVQEKLRQLPWMTDDEFNRLMDWSRRDAAEILAARGAPGAQIPSPTAGDSDDDEG
jgi:KDO2-lipid IV(A) lauroyltransferase